MNDFYSKRIKKNWKKLLPYIIFFSISIVITINIQLIIHIDLTQILISLILAMLILVLCFYFKDEFTGVFRKKSSD